jgi:hypothetical protein
MEVGGDRSLNDSEVEFKFDRQSGPNVQLKGLSHAIQVVGHLAAHVLSPSKSERLLTLAPSSTGSTHT